MIKLRCIVRYANDVKGLRFAVGDIFEVTPEQFTFLMADAPGCFVEHKAVEAPPRDKAVKHAPQDKDL